MPKITLKDLEQLSHLKIDSLDLLDRVIPLFASYKDDKWEQFVSTEKGLIKISIVDIGDGFYFSKEAVEKFEYIDKSQTKKYFSNKGKDSFRSASENKERLANFPQGIQDFYSKQSDFFLWLRTYRDNISHHGKSFDIFVGNEGFSLSIKNNHFSKLYFWDDKNVLKNELASVKSLVAYIVLNTINCLEELATTIDSVMKLPDDISPEYNVYLRSEFNKTLNDLYTYIDKKAWEN